MSKNTNLFYINNNRVLSNKQEDLEISNKQENFQIKPNNKDSLISNRILIEKLEEISNNNKKYKIGGVIDDFDNIKDKILSSKSV